MAIQLHDPLRPLHQCTFGYLYKMRSNLYQRKCECQGRIQSWTLGGHNPELDFGGPYLCFQGKSFLTPLFSIGNTTIWGAMPPRPLDPPLVNAQIKNYLMVYTLWRLSSLAIERSESKLATETAAYETNYRSLHSVK